MSSTSLVSLSSAISKRSKRILSSTPRRNEDAEERGEERLFALLAVVVVRDERGWAGAQQVAARRDGVCPDAAQVVVVRLVVVHLAARNDLA
jgi:hypothetical protein